MPPPTLTIHVSRDRVMRTKQTKSLVHLASEASERASGYLERARAASQDSSREELGFARDAMFFWEQASEAFEELSEIVEIMRVSEPTRPKVPAAQAIRKARKHVMSVADFHRHEAPTVPVKALPAAWDTEEGEED